MKMFETVMKNLGSVLTHVDTVYDLQDSNINNFIGLLGSIGFKVMYGPNISIEEKCNIFVNTINYCFSKTISASKVSMSSRDKPYVTSHCM